jgi:hypothetical protein
MFHIKDSWLKRAMTMEDEYLKCFQDGERLIAKQKRELKAQDKVLKVQDKIIEALKRRLEKH